MSKHGIDPKRTEFGIVPTHVNYMDVPWILVKDLDDPSNDDIRGFTDPVVESYFGNVAECIFEPWDESQTEDQIREFCISNGMTENKDLVHIP
jgi:hypothetical protein